MCSHFSTEDGRKKQHFWLQFSSVTQSCPTLCDPMNHSTPGLPIHHQLLEFTQTHVHHLILRRPLLLLPPIPPSIRVFSNESTLCMRWPKYWNFSFSISPSSEHPGLISFRMDWLIMLYYFKKGKMQLKCREKIYAVYGEGAVTD